jgi:phosphatidylglycerophosphate synthase
MSPSVAIIRSSGYSVFSKKIGGIFPLERIIRLLWQFGIREIVLDLDKKERIFYDSVIFHRISSLKNIKITAASTSTLKKDYILFESTHFFQYHKLLWFDKEFVKKGKSWIPRNNTDSFVMKNSADIKKGEKTAVEHIRSSTAGFVAKNINKRFSIPMSLVFARLGIHPNVLTALSFGIMLFGGSLLWNGGYWNLLIGAFIFQFISIFDGCDGEVAKLTCKFSRLGALLDTFNDYFALFYYVFGISYVFYKSVSFTFFISSFILCIAGLLIMIAGIVAYLARFSLSKSFIAYSRDFMAKLPMSDPVVFVANNLQYFTRKEFYSWIVFLAAIPGFLYLMIPYVSVVTFIGSVCVVILDFKYFRTLPKVKGNVEMTYVPRRG